MSSSNIRLQNLLWLLDQYGSRKALGEALSLSPAMLSQILSENPKRTIGDRMARRIEEQAGLPVGWMDELRQPIGHSTGVPRPKHLDEKYPQVEAGYREEAASRTTRTRLHQMAEQKRLEGEAPLAEHEVYLPVIEEFGVRIPDSFVTTAGGVTGSRQLRFDKGKLLEHGVSPNSAAFTTILGNSMSPVLPHGTTVGVDTSRTAIVDGDIYAMSHNGLLRIRQMFRLPVWIRVRSFNRDFAD